MAITKSLLVYLSIILIPATVIGGYFTYASYLTNNNGSLENSTRINDNTYYANDGSISTAIDDSGTIFIAWEGSGGEDQYNNNIYFSCSKDSGKTISNASRVNDIDGTAYVEGSAKFIAAKSNIVYVVWSDHRYDGFNIYIDKSTDKGITFADDIKVDNFIADQQRYPTLEMDDNNYVYVAWAVGDQYSENSGLNIAKMNVDSSNFSSNPVIIDSQRKYSRDFDIAVEDDGQIYLTWVNHSDGKIYFSKSTNSGETFESELAISNEGWMGPYSPQIFMNNGILYVFWHDANGRDEIFFVKSEDNGNTWSSQTGISSHTEEVWRSRPSVEFDSTGTIYVVWAEGNNDKFEFIIAKSRNRGSDWELGKYMKTKPNNPSEVSLLIDANETLYIGWSAGEDNRWDIYFTEIDPDYIESLKESSWWYIIAVISILTTLAVFLIISSTEIGKYSLIKFFGGPFYSKIKKEDVLKHNLRQRLLDHVKTNPGNHFKSIQKTLRIGSGILAYHLSVLERERYISSKRVGLYKRFFPKGFTPSEFTPYQTGIQLNLEKDDIQDRILITVNTHPGITQKELGELVGLSTTGINYHVNIMASARVLRVVRDGKWTRCYLMEEV